MHLYICVEYKKGAFISSAPTFPDFLCLSLFLKRVLQRTLQRALEDHSECESENMLERAHVPRRAVAKSSKMCGLGVAQHRKKWQGGELYAAQLVFLPTLFSPLTSANRFKPRWSVSFPSLTNLAFRIWHWTNWTIQPDHLSEWAAHMKYSNKHHYVVSFGFTKLIL